MHGIASPDDPSRELDRLDITESIQFLGKGAARFRPSDVGHQAEMVQHVCDPLGWDSGRSRGYRVRVQSPLTNAQYCIAFDPRQIREAESNAQ